MNPDRPKSLRQAWLSQDARALEDFLTSKGFGVPVREILKKLNVRWPSLFIDYRYDPRSKILSIPPEKNEGHARRHELGHSISRQRTPENREITKGHKRFERTAVTLGAETFVEAKTPYVPTRMDETKRYRLSFFKALNEGINEEMARQSKPISYSGFLGFFRNTEHEKSHPYRNDEVQFLKHVIKGMANAENRTEDQIFSDLINVNLNGWNRDFKQRLLAAFGKNSLKVLAIIDSAMLQNDERDSRLLRDMAYTYFDLSKHQQERDHACATIFAMTAEQRKYLT